MQTQSINISHQQTTAQQAPKISQLPLLQTLSQGIHQLGDLIMRRLQIFRNSLDRLQNEQNKLTQVSQRTFARLNTAIQIKIARMKDQNNIKQEKITKKRNLSMEKSNCLQIKQVETRLKTCPKRVRKEAEVIENQASGQTAKQILDRFVSKRQRISFEVYICFICFRGHGKECMWQEDNRYLSHMQNQHKISVDFEMLLRASNNKLSGSHYLFKGQLINFFDGTYSKQYEKIYYLIQRQKYDMLYYCSCSCTLKRNGLANRGIFLNETDFILHVEKKVCPAQKLSHFLKKIGKLCMLQKSPHFDFRNIKRKYQKFIDWHKQRIQCKIRWMSLKRIVQLNEGNVLELMSCYPQICANQEMKAYLLCCKYCKLPFSSIHVLKRHIKTKHRSDISQECKIYTFGTKELLQQYTNKIQPASSYYNRFKKKAISENALQNLSQKQIEGYVAELNLINNLFSENKCYICGHCKKYFIDNLLAYILHIYTAHHDLHPLNSHQFTFLKPNNQIGEFYDFNTDQAELLGE